jgi:nickel transport protein
MKTTRLLVSRGMILLIFLLFPSQAPAHGVEGTVQPGGLAVACRYGSGEPMSYAKVTVLPPEASQPFQVGYTDKNGRFCFYPDSLGEWRLTADDGMGHLLEIKVPVKDLEAGKEKLPPPGAPGVSETRGLRVLTGLSAIFGLSGFLFWFQGLRARRGRTKL